MLRFVMLRMPEDMIVFHKALFLALICTISLFALDTKEAAKHTVLNYNQLIINASKKHTASKNFEDLENFQKFASKKVAQELYVWIKSWQESDLFMDAKLLDLQFTKVDIVNKEFANINTTEKWTYRYINGVSKKIANPDSNITYKMKYQLIIKDNNWIINNIKVISETK